MGKVKASSLAETVVALVIIMTSFGIGMMIFFNVTSSTNSYNKINAYFVAKNLLIESVEKENFVDNEYDFENFTITKRIKPYSTLENLKILSVEVLSKRTGKIIMELKQLVIIEVKTTNGNQEK